VKINFAHLKERSTRGGYINFAVFDASASTDGNAAQDRVLAELTSKARAAGLNVDQSALACKRGSRVQFYGSQHLVDYLSKRGVPRWTHSMNV